MTNQRSVILASCATCAFLCLLLGGCSRDGGFEVAYTSGVCLYNGEPMPGGKLIFKPIRPEDVPVTEMNIGKGSVAKIDDEGNFEMTTYNYGDGSVIGKHRVYLSTDKYEEKGEGPAPPCKEAPKGMVVEITEGSNDLTIDLGTGKVTSN